MVGVTFSGTGELTQAIVTAGLGSATTVIIQGYTSIGSQAFSVKTQITSVTISNSVVHIGIEAFKRCSGLTSVTIGNSVTDIGDLAFHWCTGLTSVTIGNSVTAIGDQVFTECTSLTSITIPNSVTSIGSGALYNSGITTVYIANGQVISGTTFPSPSPGVPFFGRMVTTVVYTATAATSATTINPLITVSLTNSNSSIAQSPPIFSRISLRSLFTNNAQVYYKPHSLASGGIGSVRNCRFKSKKT